MKLLRRILLSAALLAGSVPTFGQCLSEYNQALYVCDQYFCDNGVFTCLGCKSDALTGYYGCVLDASMN